MGTTTVNTFPPLHALDSPRGWILALIVLLHVAFVWVLNNSLSFSIFPDPPPNTIIDFIEDEPQPLPPPPERIAEPLVRPDDIYVPAPATPDEAYPPEDNAPVTVTPERPLPPTTHVEPQPTIIEPAIPRGGLSEPIYPPSEIRAGHSGTVVLSVQVLENGRVGEVRILQSSGYAKLDESALREARRWRFLPGTRDGVPVVLWKQIPITFQIQ